MKLIVLGSGTLAPLPEKGPAGHLVEADGETLLFDCGAGTLQRIVRAGYDWRGIERVFLTHFHPDHSLDLVSLLFARNHAPGAAEGAVLRVYGPAGLKDFYNLVRVAWPAVEPKRFELELRELAPGAEVEGEGWTVRAGAASHGKAVALAYRVESGGRSLAYTGDSSFSQELLDLVRGVDCLLTECSTDDPGLIEGHLSPSGAARLIRESGARRAVVTHVYPPHDPETLAAECTRLSGAEVHAASDLDRFEI